MALFISHMLNGLANRGFYKQRATGRGDLGAGATDFAFVYPFTYPATFVYGPGVGNQCQLAIAEGNPVYYRLAVSNAPAQGAGNIAGTVESTQLLPNFYNTAENTAFF